LQDVYRPTCEVQQFCLVQNYFGFFLHIYQFISRVTSTDMSDCGVTVRKLDLR